LQIADEPEPRSVIVDLAKLPPHFPTHRHRAEFWEAFGRTVATFGFLEEVLVKAILVFGGTQHVPDDKVDEEIENLLKTLEKALSATLGGLIDAYDKVARAHNNAALPGFDKLLEDLRQVCPVRNALCHGSWRDPDDQGRSIPFFVDRKNRIFQDPIDVGYLQMVQRHAAELACDVVSTVTQMGRQFPGSGGPGIPIVRPQHENAQEAQLDPGSDQGATTSCPIEAFFSLDGRARKRDRQVTHN
jgi:hypothetical protein